MPRSGSTTERGYDHRYRRVRASILGPAGKGDLDYDPPCHWGHPGCTGIATTGDHDPPLEVAGWHLTLVPSCGPCNFGRRQRTKSAAPADPPPSRDW